MAEHGTGQTGGSPVGDAAVKALMGMPNLGKVVAQNLAAVGITTPEALRALGSREAFARVRRIDSGACISMLYALEGAVLGVRWHDLPSGIKADLKGFFRSL